MLSWSKKYIPLIMILVVLGIISRFAFAGVYFITDYKNPNSNFMKTRPCVQSGYSLTTCPNKEMVPTNFCPQDGNYFQSCVCSPNKYKKNSFNCTYPMVLGGSSCSGNYEECSCPATFRYDQNNCTSPKVLSGMSCSGKYENCSCPAEYYKTCSGMVGVGDSCNGRYKSCACPSFFKSCSEGPAENASICIAESGSIQYSQCKSNSCENGGYIPAIPVNEKCTAVSYNNRTCYKDCTPLTCSDGGYYDRNPSNNITCAEVSYGGKTCYDCDQLCSYCDKFSGKCKLDCTNDCKKNIWFENKFNGGFSCKQ